MDKTDYIADGLRHLAVDISLLTLDPRNARKHGKRNLEAIKASLQKFGFRQPIVVQKQGMVVRAGNGRVSVARELGWTHVPALVVDEADADAAAYAIADNRTAELAEWDMEELGTLLSEIRDSKDGDIAAVGFDDMELEVLLSENFWSDDDDTTVEKQAGATSSAHDSAATAGNDPVIKFSDKDMSFVKQMFEKRKLENESIAQFVLRCVRGACYG